MSGDDYTQQVGQDQLDRLHEQTALEDQPEWPPTYFLGAFPSDDPLTPLSVLGEPHHAPAVDDASPLTVGACVPTSSSREQ